MISVRSLLVLLLAGAAFAGEPKRDRFGDPLPEGAVARLGTINAHLGAEHIRFTPDGKSLVTTSAGSIRYWDASTGRVRQIRTLPLDESAISQFATDDGRLIVRMFADRLTVDELVTGKRLLGVPGVTSSSNNISGISPDGKWALVGFRNSSNNRAQLRIRSLETGQIDEWKEFDGVAKRVVFSPDSKLIAVGTETLNDGFQCRRLSDGKVMARAFQCMLPLAFSPRGRIVAVAEQYGRWIEIFDVTTGQALNLPRLRTGTQGPVEDAPIAAAFSPDETRLATCFENRIVMWSLKTGKPIRSWICRARHLAFSPDGKRLASCGGLVRVWDVDTGAQLTPDYGPLLIGEGDRPYVGLSNAAGDRIASWSPYRNGVQVWNLSTGKPGPRIEVPTDNLTTVWLLPDEKRLVVCGSMSVQTWNAHSGARISVFSSIPDNLHPFDCAMFEARVVDGAKIVSIAFATPAEDEAISVTKLIRRDLRTGKQLSSDDFVLPGRHGSVAISPDGRAFLYGGSYCKLGHKGARPLVLAEPGLHFEDVFPKAWFNERLAYSAVQSRDPERTFLVVWELASGRPLLRVARSEYPVVAMSNDGRWLALAGLDSIELWDIATGKQVPFERTRQISPIGVHGRNSCLNLAFLPDSKRLLAAHDDGTGLVWELPAATQQPPALTMTEHTWDDLASLDARVGHQAVWAMRNETAKALELLKKKLKPATMPPANELAAYVEDLGAKEYARREEAMKRLRAYGQTIEATLRDTASRSANAEQKKRLNGLLSGFQSVASRTPGELRAIRCVEALEQMKDPEAKKLLRELSRGAPSAILTQEARGASER